MFSHGYLSPLSSAAPLHAIVPSHQLQHFCSLKSWFYTCIFFSSQNKMVYSIMKNDKAS